MLQFATCESSLYSVPEQVDIAIKAGCKWIRLTGKCPEEIVGQIIPRCQDAEVILILDNDIGLVNRLRVHGLHITNWTCGEIIAAREELGPHAIIGVTCPSTEKLEELSGLDIDYMVIPAPTGMDEAGFYHDFVSRLKTVNNGIHPVASGHFSMTILPSILAIGIEGVELSDDVFKAPDPMSFLRSAIHSLE